MKLASYKEMIKATKEKVNELLAAPRAFEQLKRAELEVAKIDAELVGREQAVQELGAKYPIDFEALLDAIDELELLQRKRGKFVEVIAALFPAETPAGD